MQTDEITSVDFFASSAQCRENGHEELLGDLGGVVYEAKRINDSLVQPQEAA